jgi:hypothetical protein
MVDVEGTKGRSAFPLDEELIVDLIDRLVTLAVMSSPLPQAETVPFLPPEIYLDICSELDRPSLVAFARCCFDFLLLAYPELYKTVSLKEARQLDGLLGEVSDSTSFPSAFLSILPS